MRWLMLAGVFLILAGQATAQDRDDVSDDDVNKVANQLFCPTCESVPVDVCPTQVCADWREEIRIQLASGRSQAEILDYFAARYGEGVLANPPARGFGLTVWIAPLIIVIVGLFFFGRTLRGLIGQDQAQPPPASPPPSSTLPADLQRRIEQELEDQSKG